MNRIKVINRPGDVYGELQVIQETRRTSKKRGALRQIRCRCSCGNRVTVLLCNLRTGKTKSCGCLKPKNHSGHSIVSFNRTQAGKDHLRKLHDSLRGRWDGSFVERFWNRVIKETGFFSPTCSRSFGQCWHWSGKANTGKPGFRPVVRVSRHKAPLLCSHVAYFLTTGKFPDDFLCHVCDNNGCINPSHTFEGSAADNSYDYRLKKQGAVLIAAPTPNLIEMEEYGN